MKIEDSLVTKTYYERKFLQGDLEDHPIRQLGELYVKEQKKEMSDLSYIRFAQGEVYFHNSDFEAAIFKWENIHNELEPWAKKNMADAYFELELLDTAEDIYKSITTDSLVLNTEIALQLFTLYLEQNKYEEADQMIKNAVAIHPDYQNVTELACAFFEERKDWNSAVELAVKEAARTKAPEWFKKLHTFIEDGQTVSFGPSHFVPILYLAQKVDVSIFEQLMEALWEKHREKEEDFLLWITEATIILLDPDIPSNHHWKSLPLLMEDSFRQLLSGRYYLSELTDIMPNLLRAWMKLGNRAEGTFAATAVLAWNDVFAGHMDEKTVQAAQGSLSQTAGVEPLIKDSSALAKSIQGWAGSRNLNLHPRFEWSLNKLTDLQSRRIIVAGKSASEKTSFIHLMLNQGNGDFMGSPIPVMYQDGEKTQLQLISNEGITTVTNSSEWMEFEHRRDALMKYTARYPFLHDHHTAVIEYPDKDIFSNSEHFHDYVRMSDALLFVLNSAEPFSAEECEFLLKVKEKIPLCPIHFVLKKDNLLSTEKMEELSKRIHQYFPESGLITYSPDGNDVQQQQGLARFMEDHFSGNPNVRLRTGNMLFFIRGIIKHLLEQQAKIEDDLHQSIQHDEDLLARLKGAVNQLYDIEEEKTKTIQNAYKSLKDELRKDLLQTIPKLIKESADILREDSDFGSIHLKLNEEMNKRIDEYVQYTVHPTYISSLQDWISFSEKELNRAQELLIEWSDSLNDLMGQDRLRLECDFQILADWQRDADRMTGIIQIDKENILLKRTPAQVLLKSAGKIFGVIPANQTIMYNRYKSFIENEDFTETAESIADKFFRQFELLEKAIPRDISLFFREPFAVLKKSAEFYQEQADHNTAMLDEMKSHPEMFRDPVKLFEVRLRQMEWLQFQAKDEKYVH
ncbi:GTP-binding protein [Siminovitchia sediminis]|uniref:GTP-binding protein n=1 Tax=Siminovitchia sediminis TaxID=1274353 RepID=A0ABW4KJ81_9BACI